MKIALMVGKFSPIHLDHLKSILGMKDWADRNRAKCIVYSAKSNDKEKQPIPFERKIFYIEQALKPHGIAVHEQAMTAWEAIENAIYIVYKAEDLGEDYGVEEKGVYVFTGSDHLEEYAELIEGIKKRYSKKGRNIDFPIEVMPSAGRVNGVGISGTEVRNIIKNNDYDSFKKLTAMPSEELAKQAFDEYRRALYKIDESKHQAVISKSLRQAVPKRPEIKWPETNKVDDAWWEKMEKEAEGHVDLWDTLDGYEPLQESNDEFKKVLTESTDWPWKKRAFDVIAKLKEAFPECSAYLIGGTARDWIADADCNDIDIAVDLSKNDIMSVFPDVVSANRFGAGYIVIIEHEGQKVDIDSIVGGSILEKIRTGDMTFNCMAVDPTTEEIIDEDGGTEDLKAKRLRFSDYVFELLKRGAEARSVFRPFKFQSRWGWDFDEDTTRAIEDFVAAGYNFNRVQPNNMQKIWDQIRSGKYADKAVANLERLGLMDVLKSYEEKKSGAFRLDEARLREFGRKRITGEPDIKKDNKFRTKDEEAMCGRALTSEQSRKIDEHSILANPGIYFFVMNKRDDKDFITQIFINEPYNDSFEILHPIQKERWKTIEDDLLNIYNLPLKRVATIEEAEEAHPSAWKPNPFLSDIVDCKFISLVGPNEHEAAAFLLEFREYIDESKNFKATTFDKIKEALNDNFAKVYFIIEPAFDTIKDVNDIAKNMLKESGPWDGLKTLGLVTGNVGMYHAADAMNHSYDSPSSSRPSTRGLDAIYTPSIRDFPGVLNDISPVILEEWKQRWNLGASLSAHALSELYKRGLIPKEKNKNEIKESSEREFADVLRESGSSGTSALEVGKELCSTIQSFGNFCYFVGGASRDALMGVEPNDVDLITDMSEGFMREKLGGLVKDSFWRNGHNVLVLEKDGEEFEVSRLPRNMGLEDELSKRDLSCNSIAFDPVTGETVDPTGGAGDIENGVLEFTPFTLDAVAKGKQPARVIRFFRFVSTTGFEPGEKSKESLKKYAQLTGGRFGIDSEETLRNNWGKFEKGKNKKAAMDLMRELGFEAELEARFG